MSNSLSTPDNRETKIIVAGLGGQGVLFLTRLLSKTAIALGHSVMVSETHGMSQRGGSVISHLKIGGRPAPLIRRGTADLLLALEPNEAVRHLAFLRPGGILFVNTDQPLPAELQVHLTRLDIHLATLPASRMAMDIGTAAVANVVLAGFAAAHPALGLPLATMKEVLQQFAKRGQEINEKALATGFEVAQTAMTAEIGQP